MKTKTAKTKYYLDSFARSLVYVRTEIKKDPELTDEQRTAIRRYMDYLLGEYLSTTNN